MCAVRLLCATQAAFSASKQPKKQARSKALEDNDERGMTKENATEDENMVAEMMKVDWQVMNSIRLLCFECRLFCATYTAVKMLPCLCKHICYLVLTESDPCLQANPAEYIMAETVDAKVC